MLSSQCASNIPMAETVLIADEVLAEALDAPLDRQTFAEVLSRPVPDPFEDFWNKLRELTGAPYE